MKPPLKTLQVSSVYTAGDFRFHSELVLRFCFITYATNLFLKIKVQVNTVFSNSNVFGGYDSEKTCTNALSSTIWPQRVFRETLLEEKWWKFSPTNNCVNTSEWPGNHTVLPLTPCPATINRNTHAIALPTDVPAFAQDCSRDPPADVRREWRWALIWGAQLTLLAFKNKAEIYLSPNKASHERSQWLPLGNTSHFFPLQ